jgi:uncharacterized protein (DUF488 family)
MKVYTFGHSARTMDEFKTAIDLVNIDLLIDLRKSPQSRYYPHFNKKNLENEFENKYIFWWDFLWGSPDFHNDLLDYIKNRWEKYPWCSNNKLYFVIDEQNKNMLFSKDSNFSNNEKRKYRITSNYLKCYLSDENDNKANYFLEKLFEKHKDKNICFFCSEKDPTHCHRYHLLEKKRLKNFHEINVEHIENKINLKKSEVNTPISLFSM